MRIVYLPILLYLIHVQPLLQQKEEYIIKLIIILLVTTDQISSEQTRSTDGYSSLNSPEPRSVQKRLVQH